MLDVSGQTGSAPSRQLLEGWVAHTLAAAGAGGDVSVAVVTPRESRELNHRYRGKDAPTNVLAFPGGGQALADVPAAEIPLGDLVICPDVVEREASLQAKVLTAHWAHMIVHGLLHLCGYDHVAAEDAVRMETRERHILAELGFGDPYGGDEDHRDCA